MLLSGEGCEAIFGNAYGARALMPSHRLQKAVAAVYDRR
jgi:hypothetical protein